MGGERESEKRQDLKETKNHKSHDCSLRRRTTISPSECAENMASTWTCGDDPSGGGRPSPGRLGRTVGGESEEEMPRPRTRLRMGEVETPRPFCSRLEDDEEEELYRAPPRCLPDREDGAGSGIRSDILSKRVNVK